MESKIDLPKKSLLASGNPHKAVEFSRILPFPVECPESFECDEVGSTTEENALIKLQSLISHHHPENGELLFADDSGLFVTSLPDILGIHSSRFMPLLSQREKNDAIVEKLNSLSLTRDAHFETSIAFWWKGDIHIVKGTLSGEIAPRQSGLNGFGYDPIFIPEGIKVTTAELPEGEKDKFSHRYRASQKMLSLIAQL